MVQMWPKLYIKYRSIETLDADQKQDQLVNCNQFFTDIFIKYVQIALFDMAKFLKIQKTTLDVDDYFEDLPYSAIDNVQDHQLFENFVENELEIEVIRAIKFQVLDEYSKKEIEEATSYLVETSPEFKL